MKWVVISSLVLIHFDPSQEIILETNDSNGVYKGVLSQHSKEDALFHLVAFYSKTMSLVEFNYDVQNKEILVITLTK